MRTTSKSSTTTKRDRHLEVIEGLHPGRTILEDYLQPLEMSVNALAKELGVTAARLNEIVRGKRAMSADTALRLARHFGTTAEFWMGLQSAYEIRRARYEAGKKIEKEVRPREAT